MVACAGRDQGHGPARRSGAATAAQGGDRVHDVLRAHRVTFDALYLPVIRAVEWLADAIRPVQSGDVNLYLLYVFAEILLAYLLGAV
jgi:hypothetical protein